MADGLDNVPRIAAPDHAALMAVYAQKGQPVVLTGLLEGQPIDALRTREAAGEAFGSTTLAFGPEYGIYVITSLMHGPAGDHVPRRVTVSLDDYWRAVASESDTPMMCVEQDTPDAIAALAPPPDACGGDEDLHSTVFVGNAGNVAPFHFDGDCRHVLLHQVFGRKRVIMLPPSAASVLRPIANFATLYLRGLDPAWRSELVRSLGGWETVIGPGETVFMPALVWHGVEYLEHGMSVNYRFGRRPQHRWAAQHLHLDGDSQRFVAATVAGEGWAKHGPDWERLLRAWATPARPPIRKYLELRGLLTELVADFPTPDVPPLDADRYVPFPPAVREALLRAHLFNNRLYLHREVQDVAAWLP